MERLSAVDTAWFRMEEAKNPVDVVGVFVFAGPVDHARFRALVHERLLRSRRFRQRIVRRPLGRPRWADEPVAIDAHVHFRRLGGDGGRAALEGAISDLMSEPFDMRRPLWDLFVFDGYEGDCSVLVARLHHAMGDGFAMMALLLAMADDAPATPGPNGHAPHVETGGLRGVARGASRLVTLSFDPATELRGRLSGERSCTWSAAIPLARVKEIGHSMDATVNDVVLTALAGALRRHLEARGEDVDALTIRAMVPVNLRPPGRRIDWDKLGNDFGLVYLELPVSEADPYARLDALRRAMNALKRSPEAALTHGVLFALGLLPTRLSRAIDAFWAKKATVVATNVPGPREPIAFAGTRIDEAVFFVPHPGRLAVGASVFSYAGELRVGIRADTAVLADPHALARAFEDEIASLPGGGDEGRRRRPSNRPRA